MNLTVEMWPIDRPKAHPRNAREHPPEQVAQLVESIKAFGFVNPLLVDEREDIVAGHGRQLAAKRAGLDMVPVIVLRGLTEAQVAALRIADNRIAMNARWNPELLRAELEQLQVLDFNLAQLGFDVPELRAIMDPEGLAAERTAGANGMLAERFGAPPFSVLDARQGWWQERKRAWLDLGIQSELGRAATMPGMVTAVATQQRGRGTQPDNAGGFNDPQRVGSSIFDPVLCELVYRWFSPPRSLVLDPFAGGSVRGIVAGKLGRSYLGFDLRQEQCDANADQTDDILKVGTAPVYVCGDSRKLLRTYAESNLNADLVFTCPPYADLERYSEDQRDLSTMDYPQFLEAYREIIAAACARLKPNRFAVFVVGEVRSKDVGGAYYNFVGDTVRAFMDAGLAYYNEAILVTPAGSLPVRAGKQFSATRKLGKSHQNVLVFCKGDPVLAAKACGTVEVAVQVDDTLAPAAVVQQQSRDQVKVSAAMARLQFTQCGPVCIATNGCQGNCCDSSSAPGGCSVAVQDDEVARIQALGATVTDNLVVPPAGTKGCPFKTNGLCDLHDAGQKPWGCVASPFTLNANGTLVVRNRYKLLPCFKGPGPKGPAYQVFNSSLRLIFGDFEAARITAHLDQGGGDIVVDVSADTMRRLRAGDEIRKRANV